MDLTFYFFPLLCSFANPFKSVTIARNTSEAFKIDFLLGIYQNGRQNFLYWDWKQIPIGIGNNIVDLFKFHAYSSGKFTRDKYQHECNKQFNGWDY